MQTRNLGKLLQTIFRVFYQQIKNQNHLPRKTQIFSKPLYIELYKISILTGDLEWKYQTAALLNTGPKVTDKIVYQYVRNQGLIAIDNKSGKLIWELANGLDLLAQSAGKAYVITSEANLIVMDNKKAKQLTAFNIVGVNKHVSNTADSRIYIAEKGGWLACIEPIE